MQLSPVEVRIVGSLIEKESTTPDAYPLSLNALTNACNQSSNRDPVMDLGEDAVRWAVNNLRQQSLVRAVQQSGSRVMKYQHLLVERLNLDAESCGVLCVLMLRGPQTLGEIRARTHRLAEFSTAADVESVLDAMKAKGLVAELPRRPGQKEERYAHLLSGPVAAVADDTSDMPPAVTSSRADSAGRGAEGRVALLESEVANLRAELSELRAQFVELRRQFE